MPRRRMSGHSTATNGLARIKWQLPPQNTRWTMTYVPSHVERRRCIFPSLNEGIMHGHTLETRCRFRQGSMKELRYRRPHWMAGRYADRCTLEAHIPFVLSISLSQSRLVWSPIISLYWEPLPVLGTAYGLQISYNYIILSSR